MEKLRKILQFYINKRFLYNLILLSILFFCHCFWGGMMYVAFPILGLMVGLDKLENGISYIFFSLPFCFLNVYISPILFIVCVLVYIVKFYIIYFFIEKNSPNLTLIITLLAFLLYCVLPIGPLNQNALIKICGCLAIFIAFNMISEKQSVFRGHFNIKLVCLSLIMAGMFSLTYYFSPYLQNYMQLVFIDDNIPRFMALFVHPNVLAMFCEILLALLAYFIVSKKFDRFDIILFTLIAIMGFLTFSKTYLLILGIILIVLLIWSFKNYFKTTSIIFSCLVILTILFSFTFPSIIESYINRFIGNANDCNSFADVLNMLTTDRYSLWVEYLTYIFKNPLVLFFGKGFGASALSTISAHNGYISLIYQLGLVGIILLGLNLFLIFKRIILSNNKKINWAILIPIITIMLIFMVEDLIFYIFD